MSQDLVSGLWKSVEVVGILRLRLIFARRAQRSIFAQDDIAVGQWIDHIERPYEN